MTKPTQHQRRIRTRKGRRAVTINKGYIRPRNLRIFKKTGTILKKDRDLFDKLSERKNETGYHLDFSEKALHEGRFYLGGKKSVEIPNADFEVSGHTHPKSQDPKLDRLNYLPSPEDTETFLYDNPAQQSEIIFHNNAAFIITKTPRTSRLLKTTKPEQIKNIAQGIETDLRQLVETYGTKFPFDKEVKPKIREAYKRLGLKTSIHEPLNKQIQVPINVVD